MCFKEQGVYAVHVKESMELFISTLEQLGIDASKYKDREYVWPRMTCLFGVDVNRKKVEYIPQPSICVAMVSSGVRMWSVDEFMKEVGCDPRAIRQGLATFPLVPGNKAAYKDSHASHGSLFAFLNQSFVRSNCIPQD